MANIKMRQANHMSSQPSDDQIAAVRAFNRFYTRRLGVLDQHLMKSPFSLSEARVLYELAHRDDPAAKEIGGELGLDPGYLSRIMQKLDESGLITRKPLASDRRQYRLGLTAKGRQAFAKLDQSSHEEVAAMLGRLGDGERTALVGAMAAIEQAKLWAQDDGSAVGLPQARRNGAGARRRPPVGRQPTERRTTAVACRAPQRAPGGSTWRPVSRMLCACSLRAMEAPATGRCTHRGML